MATMKTLNGYGFNATEFNGKTSDSYLLKTDTAADSAKLGGKAPEYYIPPRNLLDNSDFRNPVNQRGATRYEAASGTYNIDRWLGWAETSDIKPNAVVQDGYITVETGGKIQQKLASYKQDIVYTAAAKRTDGTVLIVSGMFTNVGNGEDIFIKIGSDGLANVGLHSGDYLWAALYEGSYTADTLPPYVPKGYAAELAECQRYFRKSFVGSSIPSFSERGQVIIRAANINYLCSVNFDKPMRCIPNVTIYSPISKQAGKVSRFSDDVDIDADTIASSSEFKILKNSAFDLNDAYYFSYIASSDL